MNDDHRTTEPAGPMSFGRDMRHLKRNTTASLDELQAFLAEMRGRSPQEMLGMVAQSNLVRSTIVATLIVMVAMLVLTVGPFAYAKYAGGDATAATENEAAASGSNAQAKTNNAGTVGAAADANAPTDAAADAAGDETGKPAADADLVDKLGIGEEKPADASANPLENRADDLLKDLE